MFTVTNKDIKELTITRIFIEHPFIKRQIPDGLGWNKEIRYEPIVNLGEFVVSLKEEKTYISNVRYKIILEPESTTSFSFKYKIKTGDYDDHKEINGDEIYEWNLNELNNSKLTLWFQSASFSESIIESVELE